MTGKESSQSRPRGRASKAPPFLTLGDAIELARIVFKQGKGEMPRVELAKALKRTPSSSGFRRRVATLRVFGLADLLIGTKAKPRRIKTTETARKVFAPHSPAEEQEGKYEAFLKVPEFKKLLEIYEGAVPDREYIGNLLVHDFQIPEDFREDWVDCFLTSCKDAEIIHEIEGKDYFSTPELGSSHEARISLKGTSKLRAEGTVVQAVTPEPVSAELGVLPPSITNKESTFFEFPPTGLVGGTVSNISFVNMDRITPEGIEQFLEVSRGIAEFLKARIPKKKEEGGSGDEGAEAAQELGGVPE